MHFSHHATKILSAEQVRAADAHTIAHEPIASIDLMERASKAFVSWYMSKFDKTSSVKVFCGTGNNGGDGLAISRLLAQQGYTVWPCMIGELDKASPDFITNYERLESICCIELLKSEEDFPTISNTDIVIDGLFGSGLSRVVEGLHAKVINHINGSNSKATIAIDIPSGLFSDQHSESNIIIRATDTISFQTPKLAFFLPQNFQFCGKMEILDIGLVKSFLATQPSNYYLTNKTLIKSIFKKRNNQMHKGNAGRCLLIAGSRGKIGAGILAASACLRSGAGLVTIHTPKCGYVPVQSSIPEAMVIEDQSENEVTNTGDVEKYDSIGAGPGLGTSKNTKEAFKEFIKNVKKPIVLDADAINILSDHQELMKKIPEHSILTPHPGEFQRLVGSWNNDFERLEKQVKLSKTYKLNILLKGPYTSITTHEGIVFFNTTGNSGMATAGSGDVLTGIITAFLGQGYEPVHSTILGAYVHGLSGNIFAEQYSKEGLIASDLINFLPRTFKKINAF